MRATARLRQQAAQSAQQSLRSIVAIGLRQEFEPHWPLPLPDPLPANSKKHTLVLDIDETLLHTYGMSRHDDSQNASQEPALQSVSLVDYYVLLRPHVKEFLEEVNQLFEVVFWTAGTASYCCAILDALEQQVLQLPRSFYSHVELAREVYKAGSSTTHTNFYALSRTQTLEQQGYMKFLPMLGRKMSGVVMLDDNVRSFPLTPRNGVRIDAFDPDDRILQRYMFALRRAQEEEGKGELEAAMVQCLQQGQQEMARLENDRALLDVLPVLRAVAQVPHGSDVTKELDHWRDLDYVRCDDFMETMNQRSAVRQHILGCTLPSRRDTPIAPLRANVRNSGFVESASAEMKLHHARGSRSARSSSKL